MLLGDEVLGEVTLATVGAIAVITPVDTWLEICPEVDTWVDENKKIGAVIKCVT